MGLIKLASPRQLFGQQIKNRTNFRKQPEIDDAKLKILRWTGEIGVFSSDLAGRDEKTIGGHLAYRLENVERRRGDETKTMGCRWTARQIVRIGGMKKANRQ